uniref:Uncharacterized protein n=1 Tax=Chlamydomonas euryale TaxID=1486919 RepID=A0A7R9V159_9CHLO|mmetsp:Transcript_13805/g.40017  ORF Transcript_13805/g.40017 Transcript_13805/m.40017 type:complete len:145 (+) Transcript_13805:72-506(+)
MGNAQSFRLPLPVARAEEPEEDAAASAPSRKPTLESLSPDEVEELKAEIVAEAVEKVAGAEGEKIAELMEPSMDTAPYDPRFPNRNQARHCFVRYNEYHKCVFERGDDHPRCQFYERAYMSMCPSDWLENWNEMCEKGLWTGKY